MPSSRKRSSATYGVERHHAHAEAERALRHQLADAAEAEHAERLLVQLDAAEARPIPGAAGERAVRLRDVARERQQHRQRVLRGGDHVGLRRVCHHDAALGGGVDVDVVHADPGAADDLAAARPGRSGRRSSLVAERIKIPSNSAMRRSSSPSSQSMPSSTSRPASRSSCTPDSPIFSLTRTFRRQAGERNRHHARVEEDALGSSDAGSQLELVAELEQRHLQRGDRHDDVEGAEVAAVGDARDLALQPALARPRSVMPKRSRISLGTLAPSIESGSAIAVTTLALSSASPSVSRSSAASGLARGAAEQAVALVDRLEALFLDQPEGDVERADQPDRGREGVSGGSLRWPLTVRSQSK